MPKVPGLIWDAGSEAPDDDFVSLIGLNFSGQRAAGGMLLQLANLYPDLIYMDGVNGFPHHADETVRAELMHIGGQLVGATAFLLDAILDPTIEGSPRFYVERVGTHYTIHLELPDDPDSGVASVTAHGLPAGSEPTAELTDGVIDFGIPAGEKGDTGDTGPTGATGPMGPTGPAGSFSGVFAVDDYDEEECKCCE